MKKTIRALLVALSLVLLVGLASCGKNTPIDDTTEVQDLEKAKESAKTTIQKYKNDVEYLETESVTKQGLINAYVLLINTCSSITEANTIVSVFKTEVDKLKTKDEYLSLELAELRTIKISEIESYLDKELYAEEQVTEIEDIISDFIEKVAKLTSISKVNELVTDTKVLLDAISTKAEVDAEDLTDVIDDAIETIENCLDSELYYEEQQAEISDIIDQFKLDVNELATATEINQLVHNVKVLLDAVLTKIEVDAKQLLAELIEDAIYHVENYLDFDSYYEDQTAIIQSIIDDFKDTVVNLTKETDINQLIADTLVLLDEIDIKGEIEITYLVSYNTHGGNIIADTEVAEGSLALQPQNPTRFGFEFVGWYNAETGGVLFDFEKTLVTSNITIHARWEAVAISEDEVVYENDFSTAQIIGTTETTDGIYYQNPGESGGSGTAKASVIDGKLFLEDTHDKLGVDTYVAKSITSGIITISLDVQPSTISTKWSMFGIYNSTKSKSFDIRTTEKEGQIGYRLNGAGEATISIITFKANDIIKITLTIDLSTGKLSFVLKNGTVASNVVNVNTELTNIGYLRFITSNGSKRNLSVDNILITKKVADIDLDAIKANAIAVIENYINLSNVDEELHADINAAVSSAVAQINMATSASEVSAIVSEALEDLNEIIEVTTPVDPDEPTDPLYAEKTTALSVLEEIFQISLYYHAQQVIIEALLANARTSINNATTTTQINNALATVNEEKANIKTKQQIDDENTPVNPSENVELYGSFVVQEFEAYEEGLYATWDKLQNTEGYNAYYRVKDSISWIKVDGMLIREYPTYFRVDVVGLKFGYYDLQVVAIDNNVEVADKAVVKNFDVIAHKREGYAFVGGTSNGAYNMDGTLKANALVIYITEQTKNNVTVNITGANTNPCVGFNAITVALAKGKETRPIAFRLIGNVTTMTTMQAGDIIIETKTTGIGITVEGIGNDAYANGWGIRLKNASNVEIRNIGFMLTNSGEKDNVGLQQGNDHVWVHHCDFFYGKAGSDADQAKGDGALDTKKSFYVTHSYNHFWDTGKSHLVGNKEGINEQNYITFFGNWYDHSDSRHPRIRVANVHVYNNLFDGVSKYGIGATMGASVFAESNVFKNTKNPIMSSLQGTDIKNGAANGTFSKEAGGIVKAYGNLSVGATSHIISYQENNTSFDAYIASTRNEVVASNVKTLEGQNTYSNFDTASDFYKYSVLSASLVEQYVKTHSGRVQGGDFTWTFTDADNTKYDVNTPLMNKLIAYTTKLVSIGSGHNL